MAEKPISKKKIIELLLKKASGFYFSETQYEYQKTQKSAKINENISKTSYNLSFFENIDTKSSIEESCGDMLKSEKSIGDNSDPQEYLLTKKKITTHYNPPDIQAIKILFDLADEDNNSKSLNDLSDDELLKLKNKLIKELSNEDNRT